MGDGRRLEEGSTMFRHIYRLLEEELSGTNAKNIASDIWRFDRTCSYSRFAESAEYCANLLRSIGVENVRIWDFPADGKTIYGDRRMPKAWDAEEAELRIVEPSDAVEILASYRDEPLSLAMGSAATPPEGLEAELVYVENASREKSYDSVDVKGKIVFTSTHAASLGIAKKKGAIGIVSDYMPTFDTARETPMDLAEGRTWTKIDHNSGGFAFIITPRQGANLRSLLKRSGKVKVYAKVKARSYDGKLKMVDAFIPGQNPEQEFLIIAHLFEPGANDNASGSALSIELARSILSLIGKSKLARPKRSIRILLSYEFMSTMAYACTQKDTMDRMIGGINPDMVGEDQWLCKSALIYHAVPDACSSYLMYFAHTLFDYHAETMIKPPMGRQYRYFWTLSAEYEGNDCIISDPSIGVPTIQITQWPDRFYHSSLDTPDKISVYSMKKSGVIVGTFAYFLANAGPEEAVWLADQVYLRAKHNLGSTVQRMLLESRKSAGNGELGSEHGAGKYQEVADEISRRLDYLVERDRSAIEAITELAGDDAQAKTYIARTAERLLDAANRQREYVAEYVGALAPQAVAPNLKEPEEETQETEAASIIPARKVIGPLSFVGLTNEERAERSKLGKGIPASFVFWMDGKRDLAKIAQLMEQETGAKVSLERLINYCRFLERHGYVSI